MKGDLPKNFAQVAVDAAVTVMGNRSDERRVGTEGDAGGRRSVQPGHGGVLPRADHGGVQGVAKAVPRLVSAFGLMDGVGAEGALSRIAARTRPRRGC